MLSPRLLGSLAARSYATHASTAALATAQSTSGLKVFSSPDDSKLTASISVFIKAGSRHEPAPGLAHALKNSVFKSTEKRSALRVVRESELLGGVVTSSLTREHLILTAEFIKGNEGFFTELLGDVLTSSKFLKHEHDEQVIPSMHSDYSQARLNPIIKALDLAHELAFRGGLGNSLFASPTSHVNHEETVNFARSVFANSAENSIVANGVGSEELIQLVNQFFTPTASATPLSVTKPSKFRGRDMRLAPSEAEDGKDTFLLAFEGGNLSTSPEHTILQHLLGSSPTPIKYSSGTSPLSSLPVKSFHLPYSDTGLFGFIVRAQSDQVKDVVDRTLGELKKVAAGDGVDKDSVGRAVKKAQFLVASGLESNVSRVETLGLQVQSSSTTPQQLQDIYTSYSNITPDQVIQAAKKALSIRPATVAIGNLDKLPYPDDLGF